VKLHVGRRDRRRDTRIDPVVEALVLQASATLLSYPDDDEVALVAAALTETGDRAPTEPADGSLRTDGAANDPMGALAGFASWWAALEPMEREQRYVDTFDHQRRTSLNLTYFTDGDTRRRGEALLEVAQRYRRHGYDAPTVELPDHLAALAELAAHTGDTAGVLGPHRGAIAVLHRSLAERGSPFATVLGAVQALVGEPDPAEWAELQRVARDGPPTEEVGVGPEVPVVLESRTGACT
jgi:nitrate reductase delta subunit